MAVAASAVSAPASAAPREVVPGVTYERLTQGGQVLHVVRVDRGPLVNLRPARASSQVATRAPLSSIMSRLRPEGSLIGVNGDLFNFASGYPSGMLLSAGELIHEPEPSRTALGIDTAGDLVPVRARLAGEWTSSLADDPATVFGFSGLNRPSERTETILYTWRFGASTPTGIGRTDALIRLDTSAAIRPNRTYGGTVTAQRPRGGLTPTRRSVVLTGVGDLAPRITRSLKPGARVTLRPTIADLPDTLRDGVGGGPLLVADGAPVHNSGEGFTFGQVASHAARTAVGQATDGRMLLVVAEGPLEGSRGLTVNELADRMASLGARTAVAMDGGGSSAMSVAGRIVNRQAHGERSLANALVLRYTGVQLTDPRSFITPNDDGVSDATSTRIWAAKPGRAVVSLVRGDGARVRTLYVGSVGPSPRTIHLAGRRVAVRNGGYRVVARFVPADRTRRSTLARPITIDRTLGHLRLSRSDARAKRLRIGFRLTRAARVTMVVRNRSGRTVSVLINRVRLPSGARTHVWDMRVGGRRLRPGRYRVSITSRADGANRLTARFRVAR